MTLAKAKHTSPQREQTIDAIEAALSAGAITRAEAERDYRLIVDGIRVPLHDVLDCLEGLHSITHDIDRPATAAIGAIGDRALDIMRGIISELNGQRRG